MWDHIEMVPGGGPLFPVSLHFSGRFRCKKIAESNNPPIVSFLYSLFTSRNQHLIHKERHVISLWTTRNGPTSVRPAAESVPPAFQPVSFLFPLQRSRQTKQAVSGRTSEEICQAVWRTSSSDSNPLSVPKVSNKSGKKKKKVVWILSTEWTSWKKMERGEGAEVRFYHQMLTTACFKGSYDDL